MTSARGKQATLGMVSALVALLVVFALAEGVLRVFNIGYGTAPLNSDPVLHHVHPPDYTFRAHNVSGEYGGHLVYYDGEGRTYDPGLATADDATATYRVAIMGDSYAEATQVAYARSFSGRLQETAGARVAVRNYGTSSYSPIYYLVQWRTRVAAFRPTHVFVLLFSNDIPADAETIAGAVRDGDGAIVAIPGPGGGRVAEALRRLYVIRLFRRGQLQLRWWLHHDPDEKAYVVGGYVEENPDITALTAGLVLELAEEVRATGAVFTLMCVPSRYRLVHPDERYDQPEQADKWKAWAQENGIEFVDLVAPFQEAQRAGVEPFLAIDGHFNEAGHAIAAEAIRARHPEVFGDASVTHRPDP